MTSVLTEFYHGQRPRIAMNFVYVSKQRAVRVDLDSLFAPLNIANRQSAIRSVGPGVPGPQYRGCHSGPAGASCYHSSNECAKPPSPTGRGQDRILGNCQTKIHSTTATCVMVISAAQIPRRDPQWLKVGLNLPSTHRSSILSIELLIRTEPMWMPQTYTTHQEVLICHTGRSLVNWYWGFFIVIFVKKLQKFWRFKVGTDRCNCLGNSLDSSIPVCYTFWQIRSVKMCLP